MRIPLAGGQNKRFSVNQDAQTPVNLYLDADGEEPKLSPAMYKVPGKSSFSTAENRPYHGRDRDSASVLWRYRTTRVYRIDSNGNETLVGSISFLQSVGRMFKNRYQAIFVTDSGAWVSNGTSLTQVTEPGYLRISGRRLSSAAISFCHTGRSTVCASAPSTTAAATTTLDFAQAESNVDDIRDVDCRSRGGLAVSAPTQPKSGTTPAHLIFRLPAVRALNDGGWLCARQSIARWRITRYSGWSCNRSGSGVVYRADGCNQQIISKPWHRIRNTANGAD